MVNVGGFNYDIGFIEGCFTTNFRPANSYGEYTNSPGCRSEGDTTYTTPDLYIQRLTFMTVAMEF